MENNKNNISIFFFWAVAIFLAVGFLSHRGLWGPEDRWAEISREMMLMGDYFHPTINGKPYFDKPLLSYWLIVLVATVTGHLNEGIVRLPSAIAGLMALGGTMYLGRKLWSKKLGLTAGWILLSSYGFLFWARTGEADMENLAAIILAVAWYWFRREKSGFFSFLIFYVICFLGAQTKGLAAIAVPIMVLFPDLLKNKRWKSYVSFSHVFALILAFSLYLTPLLFSEITKGEYQTSGLGMVFRENIVRYFRPFDHKEPFYIYIYNLPLLFLPWTPLFVAAIVKASTSWKQLDWSCKWLTSSTILIFLFFTLSGSRRSYYILPILPFCALMSALYFEMENQEKAKRFVLKIQTGLILAIVLAGFLSPAIWPVLKNRIGFVAPPELIGATIFLSVLALTGLILGRLRPEFIPTLTGAERKLAPLILISIILMGGFFLWLYRILDTYRTMKPFSMKIKAEVESPRPKIIAFYRKIPLKMLFYLDLSEPVLKINSGESLREFLNINGETKVLVSHCEYHSELVNVFPPEMLTQPIFKEIVYPWEKSLQKYEAWIIQSRTR